MTHSHYDNNNIFARILRGEIPAHRIYEDDQVLAFMDAMPQSKGHALVLPKAPSRNLLDAQAETLSGLIPVVQKIAKAAMRAFEPSGVQIIQFNEPGAGQTVFHLHFHVIPVYEGEHLRLHSRDMEDGAVLAAHAEKYRAALG
jgi:histidine triad (HIT) family protein